MMLIPTLFHGTKSADAAMTRYWPENPILIKPMAALGLGLSLNLEGFPQPGQYSPTFTLCLIVYRAFSLARALLNRVDETMPEPKEKFYKNSFGPIFLGRAQKQDTNGLRKSSREWQFCITIKGGIVGKTHASQRYRLRR